MSIATVTESKSSPTENLNPLLNDPVEDSQIGALHPKSQPPKPSRIKLTYDIVMLIIISVDLLLISIDAILMSNFSSDIASWLLLSEGLNGYREVIHNPLRTAGGFFTLFLIYELCIRWLIAIKQRTYYRWFFFPFVHWYEVLGCFPQLRALRLFRAFVIGRRLHQLGFQVLPQAWLNWIKFYFDLVLEELSDRVILTAIDNYRQQLTNPNTQKSLIESTLSRNRHEIESVILHLLRTQLVPQLQQINHNAQGEDIIAREVGNAIQDGIANTPELRRLLRMIPIAGGLIESQLQSIGHNIGENAAASLHKRLLTNESLDPLMVAIAQGVAHLDTEHSQLRDLIAQIISDSLLAFEAQVKVQQWKHKEILNL